MNAMVCTFELIDCTPDTSACASTIQSSTLLADHVGCFDCVRFFLGTSITIALNN